MPIYKTGETRDGKSGYRVRINYTDAACNYRTKTKVVYGYPEAKLAEQTMMAGLGEPESTATVTVGKVVELYATATRACLSMRASISKRSLDASVT